MPRLSVCRVKEDGSDLTVEDITKYDVNISPMEEKIKIIKSPNGDSRTAEGKVSFEEFQKATDMHIEDVKNIMNFMAKTLQDTGKLHDYTKKDYEKQFYEEFTSAREKGTKFTNSEWYQNHIHEERHHINSYVQPDINLFDVQEMIADCVAAGLARSGEVYGLSIDKDVLYKAFENTCDLILKKCELVEKE